MDIDILPARDGPTHCPLTDPPSRAMSYLRYVLRRAAFAVVSVYLVVTATFLLGNAMISNKIGSILARARYGGTPPDELEQMRQTLSATYNLDDPLLDRYLNWLVDVTTFDWGVSTEFREPVLAVLDGRIQTTLAYVLPGVLLAVLLGILLGLVAALARDGVIDWSVRTVSYIGLAIPVFVLLEYLLVLRGQTVPLVGGWELVFARLDPKTMATIAVAISLLAGQLRFSRAAALEQTGREFVKMLRAKGIRRLGLARHVLRNAIVPIVSLSISELLAVLVLNIYVIEEVLGIPGLAEASLTAAKEADISLLIWSTMVIVVLGVALNFLQDVLYGYLDPRVRTA